MFTYVYVCKCLYMYMYVGVCHVCLDKLKKTSIDPFKP